MPTNDIPVTDAERDEFYGTPGEVPAENEVCNAIRAIHYIDFTPHVLQQIVAALSVKTRGTLMDIVPEKQDKIEEALEVLYMELDV